MTATNPKSEPAFQTNVAVLASNLTMGVPHPAAVCSTVCSTCHQPIDTPGCCTSPESKADYPNGFHTITGGCATVR